MTPDAELQLRVRLNERQHAAAYNRMRAQRALDVIKCAEDLEGLSDIAHNVLVELAPDAYKAMAERVLVDDRASVAAAA